MRLLVALVLIVYLVGVGVTLAPTIRSKWSTATAADLAASVAQDLPKAVTWPAWAYRSLAERG